MKALSIKQPFATLVALGFKTIEIRSRKTSYRGPLTICASATPYAMLVADWKRVNEYGEVYCYYPDNPAGGGWNQFGKAIATCELYECTPFLPIHAAAACVVYSPGLWAWHFREAKEIEPYPVVGQLGIYNL